MITFRFRDEEIPKLLQRVTSRSARIQQALISKINNLNTRLQMRIQQEKLMGQVLQYHSGKLFRSVEVVPATASGYRVVGGVQAGSGPAYYARYLERGVPHDWIIPKEVLDSKILRFLGKTAITLYRRTVTHPELKARSFMRSAQAEMRDIFAEEIAATMRDLLSAQPRDARGRFTSYK